MKQNIIILIPVYKSNLSDTEQISLNRCLKILDKYPICFVTYKNLNIQAHETICNMHKVETQKEYFDAYYFQNSLDGYNELMLYKQFYKRFLKYTFI